VILVYLFISVVLVELDTVNAFVVVCRCCTVFESMSTCAQGAGFFTSTVAGSVIIPAAIEASVDYYVILRVTDVPAYFQRGLKNFSSHQRP
jgi:hypothetical protein